MVYCIKVKVCPHFMSGPFAIVNFEKFETGLIENENSNVFLFTIVIANWPIFVLIEANLKWSEILRPCKDCVKITIYTIYILSGSVLNETKSSTQYIYMY